MGWSALTTAEIAQGKFVHTDLMAKIKDDLDYLHSAASEGGEVRIINGSFEVDSDSDGTPDNWTCAAYTGGAIALESTSPDHGAQGIKFTHPGGAGNGGGYADSDYFPVSTLESYHLHFITWVSAGASAMLNKVHVRYFDKDKVELVAGSPATIYAPATNPTTPTAFQYVVTPAAGALWAKVRIIGGATSVDQAGVAHFDHVNARQLLQVPQSGLKTGQGSVSVTSTVGSNVTLPGGEYGFYPQLKSGVWGGYAYPMDAKIGIALASTAYVTNIWLRDVSGVVPGGIAVNAQQRYVTSSGEVFWVYLLRDKATKKVTSAWASDDHPCMGNGGKPLVKPHPFNSYDPEKQEIILINPTREQVNAIKLACYVDDDDKPDKDFLEVLLADYEVIEDSTPGWPTEKVTVGLPAGHDWRRMPDGTKVTPIKKVIPPVDYITPRAIRKKKIVDISDGA